MRGLRLAGGLILVVVCGFAAAGRAAEPEQFFASVFLDKKKIGQFHVRISRAETGEIEELRARASVSMLGVKVYDFTHDLTQTWRDGELNAPTGPRRRQRDQVRSAVRTRGEELHGQGQQQGRDLAPRGVSQLHLALWHR